ncbi:retron Ec48 family effector membrane protein [Vibrio diazotrophicus]|uniref:retron Ec48 family effector membrane protein n=1 Tax=Vibrio diazotrophicus TaxID=685 RepID=UPI000C9E8CBF|nr:retron Ec48 family effector membrane protein [Vibrio diazotrophicus]PNH93294.1 hypothetical protein C1O24_19340 [Vibrio diazotrophicus]
MKMQEIIFKLIYLVIFSFIILTLISIASIIYTGLEEKYFSLRLCLNNDCINRAGIYYSSIINLFISSTQILAAIATALGIVVAALTFKNTSDTNALSSHISHFQVFSSYLSLEIDKRERIKISSINMFDWYNLIFKNSISGSVVVSNEYIKTLQDINIEITTTNDNATKASQGPFRHHEHQARMKKVFAKLGIEIEHYPKNDYWLIENEIITLIDSINQAFCQKPKLATLTEREYYKK